MKPPQLIETANALDQNAKIHSKIAHATGQVWIANFEFTSTNKMPTRPTFSFNILTINLWKRL